MSNPESELVAAILTIPGLLDIATPEPEWFRNPQHQAAVRAALAVHDRGRSVDDIPSLLAEARGALTPAIVMKLREPAVGSSFDIEVSCLHLATQHRRRGLADILTKTQSMVMREAFDEAEASLLELVDSFGVKDDLLRVYDTREALEALLDSLVKGEATAASRAVKLGLLKDLASHLLPGMMTVLGGDTGTGKSTLLLWLMERWSEAGGRPGVVSLEDRVEIWANRTQAIRTGHSFMRREEQRAAFGAFGEWEAEGMPRMPNHRFCILNDNAPATVLKGMRKLAAAGCDLIGVDYLQEFSEPEKLESRPRFLANSARLVKAAGKRLGVPTVMLSQLSRPQDKKRKIPSRFDLKGTGDLENMAEAIVLGWKPDPAGNTHLVVDKFKEAPTGLILEVRRGGAGTVRDFVEKTREQVEPSRNPPRGDW